jgi:SNF2 family DNA or RNA helicase
VALETVMMIANILDGRPPKKSKGPRATLIVATNALVVQWASEIKKHCKDRALSICVYTAKHKMMTNDNEHMMGQFNVV